MKNLSLKILGPKAYIPVMKRNHYIYNQYFVRFYSLNPKIYSNVYSSVLDYYRDLTGKYLPLEEEVYL
mgnify:FL=1